jgi:hypothetical protein
MRYLFLAALFLFIIILGSVATLYYIQNEANLLQEQLDAIEKCIFDENWEKSSALYESFKDKWSDIHDKWSIVIDHTEMDNINIKLGELEAFIKTEAKSSALANVNSLQLLLKHIPEKELPSLKNIL